MTIMKEKAQYEEAGVTSMLRENSDIAKNSNLPKVDLF
jgi:hypothetical protein